MGRFVGVDEFVKWAGKDAARWASLIGRTVLHRTGGDCLAAGVKWDQGAPIVSVLLGDPGAVFEYSLSEFVHVIRGVIAEDDQLEIPQAGDQASSTEQPSTQLVDAGAISSGQRKLAEYTACVAAGLKLMPQDIAWLGTQGGVAILESYLRKHVEEYRYPSQRCSFWRSAALPDRAIAETGFLDAEKPGPTRDRAAWTCRAAAHADLYEVNRSAEPLEKALRCGERALECDKRSVYACNALGRIWFLKGDVDEAEMYFARALQFAASDETREEVRNQQVKAVERSLRLLRSDEAAVAVERLVRRNPSQNARFLRCLQADVRSSLASRLMAEDAKRYGALRSSLDAREIA
jgi:tetratricopeptide (TPR) repeat protein